MGFWDRHTSHLDLMSRMFARTGAVDGMGLTADHGVSLRAAMARCAGCESTDACKEWLDDGTSNPTPPDFCPNAALIERLQSIA